MNIIETHKTGTALEVKVLGTFNLASKNMLESRLSNDVTALKIDFTECRFIDSEGVIFMYLWQQSGNKLELINPPDILFEIIGILELEEHWNLNYTQPKVSHYG